MVYNIIVVNKYTIDIMNGDDKLSKIKELRLKKGYTQEQLASLMGVSQSLVAQWENEDQFNPPAIRLKKLCELLSVSADVLLGLGDNLAGE